MKKTIYCSLAVTTLFMWYRMDDARLDSPPYRRKWQNHENFAYPYPTWQP